MWNKIMMFFLLFICIQITIRGQEYLGQNKSVILGFIETNKYRIDNLVASDDMISFTFEEEDERNRTFIVNYNFVIENQECISYTKELPIHEYWAHTILDMVTQRKAKASGQTVSVDGVSLNTQYNLKSQTIDSTKMEDTFVLEFNLSN